MSDSAKFSPPYVPFSESLNEKIKADPNIGLSHELPPTFYGKAMKQELKVTGLAEIAELTRLAAEAEEKVPGELVRLPHTGIVARLRRVDQEELALVGYLPMSLVSATQGRADAVEEKRPEDMTDEEREEGIKNLIFMRQVTIENCLEPKIGFAPDGRVAWLDAMGKSVAYVHKKDFSFMCAYVTGQEGNDGLERFHSRKTRRALASQSRKRKVRPKPALAAHEG